jgi:hypothetical protein
MITLLILVAIALMLGFTLSLVCNAVIEGQEHSVGTSIGIVVAWIFAVWGLEFGLRNVDFASMGVPGLQVAASTIGSFVILAVLLKLIITATLKQAALIALIYSIVLAVVSFGLRSCMQAAT